MGDKWCPGHGVPGVDDATETGHWHDARFFSADALRRRRGAKARCRRCQSTNSWHNNGTRAAKKFSNWRNPHARRVMDELGIGHLEALRYLDHRGLTVTWGGPWLVSKLGTPCPGCCFYRDGDDYTVYTLDRLEHIHIDVCDPAQPLSRANVEVLCSTCNEGKGSDPLAEFVALRMDELAALRENLRRHLAGERMTLFDVTPTALQRDTDLYHKPASGTDLYHGSGQQLGLAL